MGVPMGVCAIGDLQGCLTPFRALLAQMHFDPARDRLWLAGDLVNRGPDSLDVLRCLYEWRDIVQIVLGNHDLYCLARAAQALIPKKPDTLDALLSAPDAPQLMAWLREQPFFYYDADLDWAMVHGGLHPDWDFQAAQEHAEILAQPLRSDHWQAFLAMLWREDAPSRWASCRNEEDRQRFRAAVFTRTRRVNSLGGFYWPSSPPIDPAYVPWHQLYRQRHPALRVVCGHWAAQGFLRKPGLLALDSGCGWGRQLTGARLARDENAISIWQQPCGC